MPTIIWHGRHKTGRAFCIKKQGVKKMSQKLILPMDKCNVNAGYKMAAYVKE